MLSSRVVSGYILSCNEWSFSLRICQITQCLHVGKKLASDRQQIFLPYSSEERTLWNSGHIFSLSPFLEILSVGCPNFPTICSTMLVSLADGLANNWIKRFPVLLHSLAESILVSSSSSHQNTTETSQAGRDTCGGWQSGWVVQPATVAQCKLAIILGGKPP